MADVKLLIRLSDLHNLCVLVVRSLARMERDLLHGFDVIHPSDEQKVSLTKLCARLSFRRSQTGLENTGDVNGMGMLCFHCYTIRSFRVAGKRSLDDR